MEKQTLNIQLSIEIPEEYVLIKKVELEELKREKLHGVYWSMSDLEDRTNKKQLWLKENILYVPEFKKQLEEFVYYPKSSGEKWSFHAAKMADFLDKNFHKIFY